MCFNVLCKINNYFFRPFSVVPFFCSFFVGFWAAKHEKYMDMFANADRENVIYKIKHLHNYYFSCFLLIFLCILYDF